MSSESCGNCRFFNAKSTECRRFPPQMTLWATDNQHPIHYDTISVWPTMTPELWCGEWQKFYPPLPKSTSPAVNY